jgi:very-short-patch-repair endonuclease
MNNRFIHSKHEFKDRRRELRKNATPQEKALWYYLKNRKLGFRFQRQHSIGAYIADFYCAQKRLIVELDGSQHLENKEYDFLRDQYLKENGYDVLRFWNSDVDKNINRVVLKIKNFLAG